jgi:hypothetical protein
MLGLATAGARSTGSRHRRDRPCLCRSRPQGHEDCRWASHAVNQVRVRHQSADRPNARPYRAANATRPRRRGDQIRAALLRCICRMWALTGGSTMSAPTSARGPKAEMLRTAPIRPPALERLPRVQARRWIPFRQARLDDPFARDDRPAFEIMTLPFSCENFRSPSADQPTDARSTRVGPILNPSRSM